jgi:hypothetical protein
VAEGIVQVDRDAPALWGYRSQLRAHLSQHVRPHRGAQRVRRPRALAKEVGHGVDIVWLHQLAGNPGQRLTPVGHKEPFHNLFRVALRPGGDSHAVQEGFERSRWKDDGGHHGSPPNTPSFRALLERVFAVVAGFPFALLVSSGILPKSSNQI